MRTFYNACIFTAAAMLFFFNRTQAQEVNDGKETLVVDYFMRAPNVPVAYADAIRRGVIAGFAERGRHYVVDAEQLNRLKPYSRVWGPGSPEAAAEEYARLISQRARSIEAVGARYIVTGTVTGYTFSHESKDGKDLFKSAFVLLLSGYDILTGKSLSPEEIKLSGQGEKPAVADSKAIESMKYPLLFYIDRNYKFETRILELGEPDKRGKVKDIYVNCGEDIGVRRGDLFRVMLETKVGGATARRDIGKLRAVEIMGPQVTRCVISSGAQKIIPAVKKGSVLIVVSDSQSLF